MLLHIHRNHEAYWGWGTEVGEEGDYTYCYNVTTRMSPALRWAAMRATLMFHYL